MKKRMFFVIAALTLIASNVFSQKNGIGINAGVTFGSFRFKTTPATENPDMNVGFTGGFLVSAKIAKNVSLQPGLNFTQISGTSKENILGVSVKNTLIVSNIELPVNFVYHTKSGFVAGAGTSLAFAVAGKVKTEAAGNTAKENLKFGETSNDDFRSFNFGANVMAGYYTKKGLFATVNYNFGLSNLTPVKSTGTTKVSYLGIRIGYLLFQ